MTISRRGLFGLRDPAKPKSFSITDFYRRRARDGTATGDAIPAADRRPGVDQLEIETTKVGVCDKPAWRRRW